MATKTDDPTPTTTSTPSTPTSAANAAAEPKTKKVAAAAIASFGMAVAFWSFDKKELWSISSFVSQQQQLIISGISR